jgi:hypothetical protein
MINLTIGLFILDLNEGWLWDLYRIYCELSQKHLEKPGYSWVARGFFLGKAKEKAGKVSNTHEAYSD